MSASGVGLPEALERAASALPRDADAIRPANGDPFQLGRALDAAGASRLLAWLLANEPAAGEELALAWSEDAEGAGRALLSLDEAALPKPARKALRRVRHRLRSRGVALPQAAEGSVVAKLPPLHDVVHEARLGPLDPRGARVVYLAVDHPSGGVRLFEAVIDDWNGVLEFEVYSSGRRHVRSFFREFESGGMRRAVAAPPGAVRALIARAARAQPASRPLPAGFSEWRTRLAAGAEGERTPGEITRDALDASGASGTSDEMEALTRVRDWVRGRSLGPWPPDAPRARAVAEKLAQAGSGVLVVSGATRAEQVDRALGVALEEIFDTDFAEVTALRFEESAYVMWKAGREEDARAALAAARRFRAGDPVDNPVAREMLEVLFAPVLKEARGGGDEEQEAPSSLFVKP